MLSCWEQRDFKTLGEHAHWLKGSAGTAGFPAFSPVADELGTAIRGKHVEATSRLLVEISQLAERVCVDPPTAPRITSSASTTSSASPSPIVENHPTSTISPLDFPPVVAPLDETDLEEDLSGPIHSTLPTDDPEFCEIVVEFIEKLQVKLQVMQSAFDAGQWSELAGYAHWLKGSGGTAGFHAFTRPSRELEVATKDNDAGGVARALQQLRAITDRIQVPEAVVS